MKFTERVGGMMTNVTITYSVGAPELCAAVALRPHLSESWTRTKVMKEVRHLLSAGGGFYADMNSIRDSQWTAAKEVIARLFPEVAPELPNI